MKTYYCDCERYCQGDQRVVVLKATYFGHKKYCDLTRGVHCARTSRSGQVHLTVPIPMLFWNSFNSPDGPSPSGKAFLFTLTEEHCRKHVYRCVDLYCQQVGNIVAVSHGVMLEIMK